MKQIPAAAFQKQFLISLPVFINTFMMGCTNGWLPNAIYFYFRENQLAFTSLQYFLIASSSEIGKLGISIPAGLFIDKFGRKGIIIYAGILNFTCWLILSLNSSFVTICVIRIVLGITSAIAMMTSLIFIGEIASPERRGKLTSICQTCSCAGSISQCITSIIFSSHQMTLYCNAAFASLFFVTLFWTMETPNYLLNVSRSQQAKENLKYLRSGYPEHEVNVEFDKLQKYVEQATIFKKQTSWLRFVNSNSIRAPLITTVLINLLIPANGRFVISSYVTLIYPTSNFVPTQYYPFVGDLVQFIVTLLSTFYIDRLPRRTLLMVGNSLIVIIMTSCAYTNYRWKEYDDEFSKLLFLFGNILSSISYFASVMPVRNAAQSEILPQAIKGLGGSLTIITQATGNIILLRLYHLMNDDFGLHFLYVIFAASSLVLGIFLYLRLPEGKGKFLADVSMHYNDGTV